MTANRPIVKYALCAFCAVGGGPREEMDKITTRGKTRYVCSDCVKKFWTPTASPKK